jgi:hypothetical protein
VAPDESIENCVMPRSIQACRALLLMLACAAASPSQAQPSDVARTAFRACNDRAFLALSIARNYLMGGRNRDLVWPHVQGNALGEAMAEELFRRVESGEIQIPGQYAADTLFQCAREAKVNVGVNRQSAAVCFTRTDIPFFLHAERTRHVVRQGAVSNVMKRLTVRALYPVALINQVADAVYAPPEPPDLRQLMDAVAWTCINQSASAATAAKTASGASAAMPASAASR